MTLSYERVEDLGTAATYQQMSIRQLILCLVEIQHELDGPDGDLRCAELVGREDDIIAELRARPTGPTLAAE